MSIQIPKEPSGFVRPRERQGGYALFTRNYLCYALGMCWSLAKCDLCPPALHVVYGVFHKNILGFSIKKEVVMKIYDVVQPKETGKTDENGRAKTRWINLGIAFEKDGKITGIKLEASPFPDASGECWLRLFPKDKDNQSTSYESTKGGERVW